MSLKEERKGGGKERDIEIRRGRSREKHETHEPKVSKETFFHQITTSDLRYNRVFYRGEMRERTDWT